MKIKQLTIASNTFQSFNVRRDLVPQNHNIWHYHEELEFIQVLKGSGKLFVGDCIKEFSEGDVILIGANIPHYWLFDMHYFTEIEDKTIDCIVVHFKQDFLGSEFIHVPEAKSFKELVFSSQKALVSKVSARDQLYPMFEKLFHTKGIDRLILFLGIISLFDRTAPASLISNDYIIVNHSDDSKRMNIIMEYIREHFTKKIVLDDLAHKAQMTKNSFSRYFKQKTGKTPMQVVFELRISNACKLLNNPNNALKEICYDSGFNNFVSFHKVFKSIVGKTPVQYRNAMLLK